MPYRYLQDIAPADAAFEAWGDTVEELFVAAADATMNVMIEDLDTIRQEQEVTFDVENSDLDLLLFDFLNELVFYKDARRLLLRIESITISSLPEMFSLHAVARGEETDFERHSPSADVKAVTLHRLKVEETAEGWRGTVVLDI